MELSDIHQKFKTPAYLTCPVCLDTYKEPRLLPCSHTVCLECINGIMTSGSITTENQSVKFRCPLCRQEVMLPGMSSVPVNRALEDIIEDWKIRVNTERCQWLQTMLKTCKEHSKDADIWCRTCKVNVCRFCTVPQPFTRSSPPESPKGHLEHQFEGIPDLNSFCTKEAARLNEWIMVLPTIQEMFEIMKMLGTEEVQLHNIQDKFRTDLINLEREMINMLQMKISAVVSDMNKRLNQLNEHIHSRRTQLLKALDNLATKFEALSFDNQPSETAQCEFLFSIMHCKQLTKQNSQSHETDVKERVSDHRRLTVMCIKKLDRFRQLIMAADFQARSLATLLRQFAENARDRTRHNHGHNASTTQAQPMSQAQPSQRIRSSHYRPSQPFQQILPQPSIFPSPGVVVPSIPTVNPTQQQNYGPRFLCACCPPFLPTAHPLVHHQMQQVQGIAQPRQTVLATVPSTPPPLMFLNNQFWAPITDGQQLPRGQVRNNSGRHSREVRTPAFIVPRIEPQARSTQVLSAPIQPSPIYTANNSPVPSSTPAATRTEASPPTSQSQTQLNAEAVTGRNYIQMNNSANTEEINDIMTEASNESSDDFDESYTSATEVVTGPEIVLEVLNMDNEVNHELDISATSSGLYETGSEGSAPEYHES